MYFSKQIHRDIICIEQISIFKSLRKRLVNGTDIKVGTVGTAVPGKKIRRKKLYSVFEIGTVETVLS